MKKNLLLLIFLLNIYIANSQTLGGYTVYGNLISANNPQGCVDDYVVGLPDDSISVNFYTNDSLTALFSVASHDSSGNDLLLETAFDSANYIVSLLLSNGIYTSPLAIDSTDWILLSDNPDWNCQFTSCSSGIYTSFHLVLPLDFSSDFGLTSQDTVVGIKIKFLLTNGWPDFAGAYLISPLGSGINENIIPLLKIFPNPFSDLLNISAGGNQQAEITIYDATLKVVFQHNFNGDFSFSTKALAPGIYCYSFNNGQLSSRGKLIKL